MDRHDGPAHDEPLAVAGQSHCLPAGVISVEWPLAAVRQGAPGPRTCGNSTGLRGIIGVFPKDRLSLIRKPVGRPGRK